MSAETLAMPWRCEPHAPSFAGDDDEGLVDFVEQFDALTNACKLTEDEKCDGILRYVDRRSKQLWITLASYELRDYQKFKDEILYQYPVAWKAAQRRSAQLARHRTPEKIERPAQIVHSPTSNVPASTASYSRLPELSPVLAHSSPAPVSRHVLPVAAPIAPILVARPVVPVPAAVVRHDRAVPAPATRRDLAPPIVRPALAVPAVHLVHAPSVVRSAAPRLSRVRAVLLDRQNHAAPVRRDLPAPVFCPAAPFVRHDHAAPPPFRFHPAAAPFVPSTAALPFPLCPSPALSASVTAQDQPASVKVKHRELTGHAVPPSHHRVTGYSSRRCVEQKDVAILKEEGRGQQAVVQLNDDENERRRVIEQQQEDETQPSIASRQHDGDSARRCIAAVHDADKRSMADEERTQQAADEDRSWMADEDQREVEHRQENSKPMQQRTRPQRMITKTR